MNTKYKIQDTKYQKGLGLVELIVVIGISALLLFAFSQIIFLSDFAVSRSENVTKALWLAEEAMEAARIFRNRTSWSSGGIGSLTVGASYYPQLVNNDWVLVPGEEIIAGSFKRIIRFDRVYRDANHNIASSGTEDAGSRKITITVQGVGTVKIPEVKLTSYLMNWR